MYDQMLRLQDAAAKTATGYGTIGGNAQTREIGAGHVTGRLIVRADNVAHDVYSPNQHYILILEGGDVAAFTNVTELARIELGYSSQFDTGNVNKFAGKYEVPFSNKVAGVIYPWVRMRHVIAGVSPSITYRANLGRLP